MWPKIELHLHLDCSLSYEVVARLNPAVSWAQYRHEFVAPARCTSLADFLTRAPKGFQLMQDRQSLELVTEDLFGQLEADGVLYAEIRFAPLLHTGRGLTAAQVVEAVDRATERSIRSTGIEARLILCTLRHFEPEQGMSTARLVEQFRGSRVVALDIAADEARFPIDANLPAFRHAIENGIARTAHAGEARGADSVWETLENFQPSRIGHGVRSIEDPALVNHLRKHRIHLEVCPTSNVQTCVFPSYRAHCVDQLLNSGISLGISTDARTIADINLTEEYRRLGEHFGWGPRELLQCNRHAVEAAFVHPRVKEELLRKLDAGYPVRELE